MRTHTIAGSPVGELTLVADDGVLSGLYMVDQKRRPSVQNLGDRNAAGFEAAQEQLGEYFAGERTVFELATAPVGNAFQLLVWKQLTLIPFGETRSYGDLARELGSRTLAQAVGSANGRNPLGIIVPCHRVVGSDGSLVGYAGGLERKEFLLQLENPARAITPSLF